MTCLAGTYIYVLTIQLLFLFPFFTSGYIMAGLWGAQNANDRQTLRHLAEVMVSTTF